jgi:hypothetical protein
MRIVYPSVLTVLTFFVVAYLVSITYFVAYLRRNHYGNVPWRGVVKHGVDHLAFI